MTDKLLREAAQNILNGIETGAIKIETDQDESWANALSALRSALAQSESEPDKLEKAARAIYDIMPFDGVGSEKKPAWVEGGNSLKQDEARRYARAALAEAQQGEGDGPALKCQYPMITTVDRSKDGNCTVKAVKHPDGTFEVIKVEFQGNPCPTCHGTGVVTNHGWSDDPTGEAKPVRPCPTCHGEKP
jgi:hypothetical protein